MPRNFGVAVMVSLIDRRGRPFSRLGIVVGYRKCARAFASIGCTRWKFAVKHNRATDDEREK